MVVRILQFESLSRDGLRKPVASIGALFNIVRSAIVLCAALCLAGCTEFKNPYVATEVVDESGYFTARQIDMLKADLSRISREKDISIVVAAVKCGDKLSGQTVINADGAATPKLDSLSTKGSIWSVVIVVCVENRFLTFRYSESGRVAGVASGIVYGEKVRLIQERAFSDPLAAINSYLKMIQSSFQKSATPGDHAIAKIGQWLSFNHDAYWYHLILSFVLRVVKVIVPHLNYPETSLVGVVVLGLGLRWVAIALVPFLLSRISSFLGLVSARIIYVLTEFIWTIPVIGLLDAAGGGLLDNLLIMSSLADADLSKFYALLFEANRSIGSTRWWMYVPFGIIVSLAGTIPFLMRASIIESLSPEMRKRVDEFGAFPWERLFSGAQKSIGWSFWEVSSDLWMHLKVVFIVSWVYAFSLLPPIVVILVGCRSIARLCEGLLGLSSLLRVADIDQRVATGRPVQLQAPIILTPAVWANPVGVLLGVMVFTVILAASVGVDRLLQSGGVASASSGASREGKKAGMDATGASYPANESKSSGSRFEFGSDRLSDYARDATKQAVKRVPSNIAPQKNVNHSFAGRWSGSYYCAQGLTRLILDVGYSSESQFNAKFSFHVPNGSRSVNGEFLMRGAFDSERRVLALNPTMWLRKPEGYNSIKIVVWPSPDGQGLLGDILHPGCNRLQLRKVNQ